MNFIKRVLSTVTGIFVFLFICFGLIVVIGLIAGSSTDQKVMVRDNSILDLKLDFPIKDYAGNTVFKQYSFMNENRKDGLFNIIDAIKYAATDEKIKGISIDNNLIQAGFSQTKAIRDALLEFKKSDKFIVAYADVYSQKDYYLSSVADTIYMNPAGMMEFNGLSTELLYYKDFQDQTGLKMEVIRLGKYKSAVEPFLENEMSENNREQIEGYLNGIWSVVKNDIAESRNLTTDRLDAIADDMLSRTPSLAKSTKMIDKIAYYDEYEKAIKQAINVEDSKKINTISIKDYALHTANKLKTNTSTNRIAVIYAEGEIIYGEGDAQYVGQGAVNRSLKEAREDDRVKAVVIRVNSPGGSALASELIWREIELTKTVKPVIVSMGDLAASGGYYIACNADKIIAEPTTITGSIGVFGMLPNVKGLADKWGINAEQVSTNKNSIIYSVFEPMSDAQEMFIKGSINDIYELFTHRVAEGRGMTQDNVNAIAEGRVWTGVDALNNGLVDALGGMDLALKYAAEAADIEDYKIKELPVFEKDLEKILQSFGLTKAREDILKEELGETNYKIMQKIKSMSKKEGIQLLFPFSTEIK